MIGTIPKSAVRAFFARKRSDYRPWKNKTLRELQDLCDALPVKPPIWKRFKKHQRVCFLLGVKLRRFCFWNDTGTGKTMLSLGIILYAYKTATLDRALVLVPNRVNKWEWRNDVAKHSPNTEVLVLTGSSRHKWQQIVDTDAKIIVETYGGFVRLLTKVEKPGKKANKKKPRLVPDLKKIKAMRAQVQGLFMDESIYVIRKARFGSLAHRLCKHMAKTCTYVFALNGTPFGKDPTDLWGQVHLVDEGYSLGETLGLFRAAFFTSTEGYFGGATHKFKKKMWGALHGLLANTSIRYEADAADLPHVVPIIKEVRLPKDAQAYYDEAKAAVLASRGNYREQKNAFMRMRQVSSGFVGYKDDETGEKARYAFTPNPKLESLISYIEEIERGHKSVVFHQFTYSGDLIAAALKERGIKFVRIYGKTKDADLELNRFKDDAAYRVCLLQNDAGGYGLDRVKVARYGLYYESPVSTVLRKQTTRRVERQYSEHESVFIVDFVTRGTVDAQILDAHREGFDLFEAVVEGRRGVI